MCFPQNFHSRAEVENIFDRAYSEVKRIEDKFTDFHPSDFNKINDLAGIRECCVDEEIFSLVEKSLSFSEKSKGIFDISFASVGHVWRKAREHSKEYSMRDRADLVQYINYKKIKLDKKKRSIFLPYKEMKIGLGGIGKGYAVDRAFALLRAAGLYNFYINGSGDIRVHARNDAPRPWKIAIRNPLSQDAHKSVGLIQLANGAVATSGSYLQKMDNRDGELDHHIIHAATGRSVGEIISATVLSSSSLETDVTATILMNLSVVEALLYVQTHGLYAVIIDRHGKSYKNNPTSK